LPNHQEPTFGGLFSAFLAAKKLFGYCVLGGIFIAIVMLETTTPSYTITAILAANQDDNQAQAPSSSGVLSSLLNGDKGTDAKFNLFQESVTSMAVAERLFADPAIAHTLFRGEWDPTHNGWRQPGGLLTSIKNVLRWCLGRPGWSPPSPYRLQQVLQGTLIPPPATDKLLKTFSLQWPNPKFGKYLLSRIIGAADDVLRQRDKTREADYNYFLQMKLETERNVDIRQALAALALQNQRTLVLLDLKEPYTMSFITPVYASDGPTSPSGTMYVLVGIFAGILIACCISGIRYFKSLQVARL
jgi:hypothetical protein